MSNEKDAPRSEGGAPPIAQSDGSKAADTGSTSPLGATIAPNPDTSSSPAPGSLEALRAELGLPLNTLASKATEKTPPSGSGTDASAKAAGDSSSNSDTSKTKSLEGDVAADPVKPEADDSEYAARVARLARMDREVKAGKAANQQAKEAVEAKEKELHGAAAAAQAHKEAKDLFASGKRREAILRALDLDAIPEDLFADLASDAADKSLSKHDVDQLVNARLKEALEAQAKASEDATKAEEASRAKVIEEYETDQVSLAVDTFELETKKWPLLHKLATQGEQEQEYITAKYLKTLRVLAVEGKEYAPTLIFDKMEKDYAELAGNPAPESKTISEDTRRGTVPAPAPVPQKAEDRWKQRDADKEAFLAQRAKERGLKWE